MKAIFSLILFFGSVSFAQSNPTASLWEGHYTSNDSNCPKMEFQVRSVVMANYPCLDGTAYSLAVYSDISPTGFFVIPQINCGPWEEGKGSSIFADDISTATLIKQDDGTEVVNFKKGTIGFLRIPIYKSKTIYVNHGGALTVQRDSQTCYYQKN